MARVAGARLPLNAEINVVSLIDVMLLLLVIFMITAPMMQGGVDVALPKAEAKPLEPKSGLVVIVDRSGRDLRGRDEDDAAPSSARRSARSPASGRSDGVYLRGDAGVPYGVVTQVLAIDACGGRGRHRPRDRSGARSRDRAGAARDGSVAARAARPRRWCCTCLPARCSFSCAARPRSPCRRPIA